MMPQEVPAMLATINRLYDDAEYYSTLQAGPRKFQLDAQFESDSKRVVIYGASGSCLRPTRRKSPRACLPIRTAH